MNETVGLQDKDLPCYECLCLAICKGKSLRELVKCEHVYNFLQLGLNLKDRDGWIPYDSYQYDRLIKFMRVNFMK